MSTKKMITVGVLLLVAGAAYYYFFVRNDEGEAGAGDPGNNTGKRVEPGSNAGKAPAPVNTGKLGSTPQPGTIPPLSNYQPIDGLTISNAQTLN